MSEWQKFAAPVALVLLTPAAGFATQYLTVKEAQVVCFPAATGFESADITITPEQKEKIENESGQRVKNTTQKIWRAVQGGKLLGYLVLDFVVGKHELIDYAVAINPDGTVKQVEILEYRETYGGEIKNESWRKQFAGKSAESKLSLAEDIKNISGATYSSKHITEGVKRVLVTFHVVMQ